MPLYFGRIVFWQFYVLFIFLIATIKTNRVFKIFTKHLPFIEIVKWFKNNSILVKSFAQITKIPNLVKQSYNTIFISIQSYSVSK